MRSRLFALILAFAFFISSVSPVLAAGMDWSTMEQKLYQSRIVLYPHLDRVDQSMNRAEFVTFLYRAVKPAQFTCVLDGGYTDVPSSAWYALPACYNKRDAFLPTAPTQFEASRPVTRIEAVRALARALGYTFGSASGAFADVSENDQSLVQYAVDEEWITPVSPQKFAPDQQLLRKEIVPLIFGAVFQSTPAPVTQDVLFEMPDSGVSKFQNIQSLLKQVFIDGAKTSWSAAYDKAFQSFVSALGDPYTVYLPATENKSFQDTLNGEFEGIGAVLDKTDSGFVVQSVLPGSPAFSAGVHAKDIIFAVDGTGVTALSLSEVIGKIRGPKDTSVRLTLIRDGQTLDIAVVRGVVTLKDVESKLMSGMWYIRVTTFGQKTADDFITSLKTLESQGVSKLIVDLRDNPGGLIDTAVSMVSPFTQTGNIVVQTKNRQWESQKYTALGGYKVGDLKVVVLINKGSASASEIFAGALRDYKKATLIGETTFGKGSAQQVYSFGDGSALKVTTDYWYTPLGTTIQHKGIVPDQVVPLSREEYLSGNDAQLDAAVRFLAQ